MFLASFKLFVCPCHHNFGEFMVAVALFGLYVFTIFYQKIDGVRGEKL